jgi:hypothetical protein
MLKLIKKKKPVLINAFIGGSIALFIFIGIPLIIFFWPPGVFSEWVTETANNVAFDSSGNAYVIGLFSGTCDFDPGPGVAKLTSIGSTDVYLTKFDTNGSFQWAISWGSDRDDQYDNPEVAVDSVGDVCVISHFYGKLNLGTAAGGNSSAIDAQDLCLAKFDSSGTYKSALPLVALGRDWREYHIFDHDGNVYFAGEFKDIVDLDPGNGMDEHTSKGLLDIYLRKFDSSMNFQWARTWGGPPNDDCYGMSINSKGNIAVLGHYVGNVDLDPGPGVDEISAKRSARDYISSFDTSGNYLSSQGPIDTYEFGLVDQAADQNGNTYTSTNSGAGHSRNSVILKKEDSSGILLWTKSWFGDSWAQKNLIALDPNGNVYVTGSFNRTVDFDPSPEKDKHKALGFDDIFLTKFDASGNFLWARTWGGKNLTRSW